MQAQLEKFEKEQTKYDDELSGIDEKLRNARDDRRVNREQEAMNEAIDAMKRLFPVTNAFHTIAAAAPACCRAPTMNLLPTQFVGRAWKAR